MEAREVCWLKAEAVWILETPWDASFLWKRPSLYPGLVYGISHSTHLGLMVPKE